MNIINYSQCPSTENNPMFMKKKIIVYLRNKWKFLFDLTWRIITQETVFQKSL